MKKVPFSKVIMFCLIVVLSACSSSDHDSSSADRKSEERAGGHAAVAQGRFNSCDLLSTSDIQEFFPGAEVKITKQGDTPLEAIGQRICFYNLSENDMIFVQTSLSRTSDMGRNLIKYGRTAGKNYQASKEIMDNTEKVEGIGMDAWYGGSGLKVGAGLHVLVDENTALTVNAGLGTGSSDKSAHLKIEKALAEKMIEKLPGR
jgi:hypothetical protein